MGWFVGRQSDAEAEARTARFEQIVIGEAPPGWLGVVVRNFTAELAEATGLPTLRGALVSQVVPDSPATATGIKPGDVIVRVGSDKVVTAPDLLAAVAQIIPGTELDVRLVRRGEPRQLIGRVQIRPAAILQ